MRKTLATIVDEEFLKAVEKMKKDGWSNTAIAEKVGISVSKLRAALAVIKDKNHEQKEN